MHQIGVGVLGPVFRTYHQDDDRLVALKAFRLEITPEQADTLATALEGVVQLGLDHPTLVTPIGAGVADGVPYLALEYVTAESLDVAWRHDVPAAVGTALSFVVQLAEALDAAHAVGLSHGALHPRDVFVTPDLARVTGFGVVSALDTVGLRGPLRRPYTAPEQITGAEWGPAVDRFALAAIAYELLTGRRLAGTGEQLTDRLAGVPGVRDQKRLSRLFACALADTPETRPMSARLFADKLAEAVGWSGAAKVRQALVGVDSDTSDPEHQVVDGDPVIDVTGVSASPTVGVETTGTEEAARDMAKISRRKSTPESQIDWTERQLDRGESDELREPEAYQPRPPGARAGVEPDGAARRTDPDFDRIDTVLANGTAARRREASAERRGTGLFDPLDDPDEAAGPDVGEERVGEPGDVGDPGHPGHDDEVELSVVQARYRPVTPTPESSGDPGSQVEGVYQPITLSDPPDRPGDAIGRFPDNSDSPDSSNGGEDPVDPEDNADRMLLFESDLGLDDAHDDDDDDDGYRDDEDEFQAGLVASGWADRVRTLPVVPLAGLAVVVTVAAFAVGFGWLAGGDEVATDESSATEAVVADRLAATSDAEPVESAPGAPPQLSREYSEATIAEAPAETVSAPPALTADRAPEEPVVPEPASRLAPVAATEATLAPVFVAPSVPAPTPTDGRLLVRSIPPGVRVLVNGDARGTTPLALADLSYGVYDIQFVLEGYQSQQRRLAISSDAPIVAVTAELVDIAGTRTTSLGVGSVFVDTRPRGVEVWLDQQLVGESPMLISNVSMGAHEVEFKHVGYRDWATTVQVGSAVQARVTASLDHVPR